MARSRSLGTLGGLGIDFWHKDARAGKGYYALGSAKGAIIVGTERPQSSAGIPAIEIDTRKDSGGRGDSMGTRIIAEALAGTVRCFLSRLPSKGAPLQYINESCCIEASQLKKAYGVGVPGINLCKPAPAAAAAVGPGGTKPKEGRRHASRPARSKDVAVGFFLPEFFAHYPEMFEVILSPVAYVRLRTGDAVHVGAEPPAPSDAPPKDARPTSQKPAAASPLRRFQVRTQVLPSVCQRKEQAAVPSDAAAGSAEGGGDCTLVAWVAACRGAPFAPQPHLDVRRLMELSPSFGRYEEADVGLAVCRWLIEACDGSSLLSEISHSGTKMSGETWVQMCVRASPVDHRVHAHNQPGNRVVKANLRANFFASHPDLFETDACLDSVVVRVRTRPLPKSGGHYLDRSWARVQCECEAQPSEVRSGDSWADTGWVDSGWADGDMLTASDSLDWGWSRLEDDLRSQAGASSPREMEDRSTAW